MGQRMYKQPQKREVMAGSRLEISMLEFSLKGANEKLEKKQEELDHVNAQLEQARKLADDRADMYVEYMDIIQRLKNKVLFWKIGFLLEAIVIISYILLQVVG